MQLFQLIHQLDYNTAIIVYAIDKRIICEVENKTSIPIDLYEYDVLTFGIKDNQLYIELVK